MDLSNIKYEHTARGLTQELLVDLWHNSGYEGVSDRYPKRLLEAIQRSDYIVVAWDGDRPIGLCACMSNSLEAYVSNLLVREDYRHNGIGSRLINCAKQYYDDCLLILCTANAIEFYSKNGFDAFDNPSVVYIDGR